MTECWHVTNWVRKVKKTNKFLTISAAILLSIATTNLTYANEIQAYTCAEEYKKVTTEGKICEALDKLKDTVGNFSREAVLGENINIATSIAIVTEPCSFLIFSLL